MIEDSTGSASWGRARAVRRERDTDTQGALLSSAAEVFARQGYPRTSVTDITSHAGLSRPSFYAYFESKAEVFRLIARRVRDEVLAAHVHPDEVAKDPVALSRASVRSFLTAYAANLALLRAIEDRAGSDPEVAEILAESIERPHRRTVRHITGLQRSGLADPVVDPYVIASAMRRIHFMLLEPMPQTEAEFDERVEQGTAIYLRLIGYSG